MPRGAATVQVSHEAHVEELLRKAKDLEDQLKQSQPTDDRSARLRIPLCECLANLMLTDPSVSAQKDVPGRLWKNCFYTRIGPWRNKNASQKRRGIDVSASEEKLGYFLSEGVTLYEYLIQKLREKLARKYGLHVAEGSTPSYSQDTSTASPSVAPPSSPDNTDGVVALLAACHVSLGDLFRYANNLQKAELSYRTAASLAPGSGQAFNQLAVICQLKERQGSPLSAVALYWYTRSLLVTEDPFLTARDNLTRLLESTHKWLQQEIDPATGNDRSKSAETRYFLCMFVDLQYRFYQGIAESTLPNSNNVSARVDATTLMEQMQKVMDRFQTLLEVSSFGDSLLCRLVVILSFSECFLDRPQGAPSVLTMVLARVATYQFGRRLTDRVMHGLAKVAPGKLPSSVRLLLPVLLLAQYTAALSMPGTDNGVAASALEEAQRSFWEGMTRIWNQLRKTITPELLSATDLVGVELKAFLELRAFGPFRFLPDCKDGLVPEAEAVRELLQNTGPNDKTRVNETASTSTGAGGTATDQGRLKLVRLMQLADKLAADEQSDIGSHIHKNENGDYIWIENAQCEEYADSDQMEVQTEEESMLVYKASADGGPALLVPNMMLQQEIANEQRSKAKEDTPQKMRIPPENQHKRANSEQLPVFDTTPVNLQNMETPLVVPHPSEPFVAQVGAPAFTSLGGICMPPPGMGNSGEGLAPPPGFGVPTRPLPSPAPQSVATGIIQQTPETLGEAMRLYGNQLQAQTANPFASPPAGLTGAFPYSAPAPVTDSFFGDDLMSAETSLLDSGLLNSLWMDDSKTKTQNPFAT